MPGKNGRSDPRPNVRVTRGASSGRHLASVLQEGRENANIDAGLGFLWKISVKSTGGGREPLTQLGMPSANSGAIRAKQTCRELGRACRFDMNEHHATFDRRGINRPCARLCKSCVDIQTTWRCFDAENHRSPQIGARGGMGA